MYYIYRRGAEGAGVLQLRAHNRARVRVTASEKVLRVRDAECERKRPRKCKGTPEAEHPRPLCAPSASI